MPLPSAEYVENLKLPGEYDELDVSKLVLVQDIVPAEPEVAAPAKPEAEAWNPDLYDINKYRSLL